MGHILDSYDTELHYKQRKIHLLLTDLSLASEKLNIFLSYLTVLGQKKNKPLFIY
jgi:hypothetical protein